MAFDVAKTILSQYAGDPVIPQLIANMDDYFNPCVDFDNFYNLIWNIDTAVGYGLDVWGRILGVGRTLNVSTGQYFGFGEASDAEPFGQGAFYDGQPTTSNYALVDADYRILLYAKALANITDGSVPSITQIMLKLFPGMGDCYCTDGLNETMTYTFTFPLSPVQLAIVAQSGVLPRPPGVAATVVHP